MRTATPMTLICALLLLAPSAEAFNPGTDSRAQDTASLVNPVAPRFCEGGPNAGAPCTDSDPDCAEPAGFCTGISGITVAARGLLTIIADTVPPASGWDEAAPTGCSEPAQGAPSDCEIPANSTLTLMLEFALNGQQYVFAQTYKDLDEMGEFLVEPAGYAGWVQPAVESIIAERAAFPAEDLAIRWGVLSPAAEAQVRSALGGAAPQRVTLSRVDDVPICTDSGACNHTVYQDQSGADEVLASVRRFKVDIALVNPGP